MTVDIWKNSEAVLVRTQSLIFILSDDLECPLPSHQADDTDADSCKGNRTGGRNSRIGNRNRTAKDKCLAAAVADRLDVNADAQRARCNLILQISQRIDAECDCKPLVGINAVLLYRRVGTERQAGCGHKGRNDCIASRQLGRACPLRKLNSSQGIVN